MRLCRIAVLLSVFFASHSVLANEEIVNAGGNWSALVGTQITFGGDTLITLDVEDIFGDVDETKVKAGELFGFFVGGAYRFADSPFQIQATVGWHAAGIFAENGDASFNRFPVELLGFMNFGPHRVGAGVTHHLSPSFEYDSDFSGFNSNADFRRDFDTNFEDATGFVVQYDYQFGNHYNLGVRYVDIEYTPEVPEFFRPIDVDGRHGGIIFSFIW